MPNWCDNMVTLSHPDKSKIDALDAEMSKKNDSHHFEGQLFQHLVPNPAGEWNYDWSIANWGTKWDASIIDYERRDDNTVWVSFESAWSPPTTAYDTLVEEGWEVEAVYYEPGMGYGGVYNSNEGGDDYYEFDLSNPESIEDLPGDLIEFGDLRTKAQDWLLENMADEWADAERTDWHSIKIKPEHDGYYEVQVKGYEDRLYEEFCQYKNGQWDRWSMDNVVAWRGLAEDPSWDPAAELDKIVAPE